MPDTNERDNAWRLAILEDHVKRLEHEVAELKKEYDELTAKTNKAAGGIIVLMGLGAIFAWLAAMGDRVWRWFH